jgi:hypothetical protein
LLLALAAAPLGCAESIGFDDTPADEEAEEAEGDGDGDATGDGDGDEDERVEHDELGGGVVRTTVDASDEQAWVYLDLDSKAALAEGVVGWDLGFRRFEIILNGGINGDEGVELAFIDGVDFETLTELPDDLTWITDAADGDDENMDPDLAFFDWYDYDIATHVLTPKDRVYLVRSSDGALFKLQIANYYSEAGSSGFMQFYWAAI